ncbi:hypothetical protein BIV57_00495 [Mangrovactinospora gilvigrisea]|uniref:Uncharacterized protein n=1 Tax=Mangrovactinospora gilvigrisea TaxID=1428644 RepID=A0A1J7CCT9_9ACTN|nr:hypothetical protein [Mangrovactinospora gilvigrisea]OIV39360.1 hypothetical protein BIV57_00495 [Mangrovactinospora gilvigrisea]
MPETDDVDFPQELIDAQRTWNQAIQTARDFADAHRGPDAPWGEAERAEWKKIQQDQVEATLALRKVRAGTDYDTYLMRQKLKDHVHAVDGTTSAEA